MEDIVLKTKKSELLTVVNLILRCFTIIVFFIGIIPSSTAETVVQTCLMVAAIVIFEYLNSDTFTISDKGVNSEQFGFIKWNDLEILKIDRKFIYLKPYHKKQMRIEVDLAEDKSTISKASKYINSKLTNASDEYEIEIERKRHSGE